MKAKPNAGRMPLETLPTEHDLWGLLNHALLLPPEARLRLAEVARERHREIEIGYFGSNALPKDLPRDERFKLRMAIQAFGWAMETIGFRPQDGYRKTIAFLVPTAGNCN